MKKWIIGLMCVGMFASVFVPQVQAQTSSQNFGTGTGEHTSQTGSADFIPNPTGSGTTWARAGAVAPAAPIVLATAGNPLGTAGSYVRGVASSSTSVSKFSPMVGYSGSTEFYTSFKVLFGDAAAGTTAANGSWTFYQGAGAMYTGAADFAGAQVFASLRATYAASGGVNLNYRGGANWITTGMSSTNFNQGTVYTVEIVGNNKESGTISYTYNGAAQTVAPQKFDLFINGTRVGDDLAAAIMPANTSIDSVTFIGISSTDNAANVFVDDVVVYNAVPAAIGGPVVFGVTFDKPEGFEIEEGAGATITATAANGAEPYSYEWSTTVAIGDYNVAGNVFTILPTAATGNFSATVTVTDDDDEEAVNTINFSVVAPAPKYAITITPPVNGTVTTTPEDEAEAGQTVTINANPAGGYAVDTITVVDAALNPVAVAGGSFTMPASAVTITVTFAEASGETYIVDFEGEGETKAAFASATVNLSGMDWDMTEALIGTTDSDWKNGVRSARMRGYGTSAMTMLEDLPTGLGTISFQYRRYGTDAQVDWRVEYSSNGGTSWTQIGADFTAPASDEVQTFSEAVNVAGSVRVRIKRATEEGAANRRLNLDDITMTPAGAAGFSVSFDKADGFEIEEGAGDAITATAVGGAEPYSYEWVSSLSGAHYEAINNVFTILPTAPIGDYSATVTVTDDDEDEAVNTINFSVVAPTPKYDIFIVPADNGQIATDPENEAEAGQTVTVITTPDPGYALETITVTQADTTPVPVTGNTFVMPAQAVYVTAAFIESQDPDALIDFESGTFTTTYAESLSTLEDGNEWASLRVLRGNLDNDRKFGTYSARFNPSAATNAWLQQTEPYAEPITKLSFWVASYGSDNMANVVLLVQVSSDGETWDTVKTLSGAADITDTLVEHIIETIPEGAVYVRFYATAEAAANKRFNIDNIAVYHGEAAPHLTYTGSTIGTVGVQMALDFTLHGASAEGWGWWVMTADRDPVVGAEGDSYQVRWTPHAAGDYILTVTAYGPGMEILAQREVSLTVNPPVGGDPEVVIGGDFNGTVGVQMDLTVELLNATGPDEWWFDLRNPDNDPVYTGSWNPGTGLYSFTPDVAGSWNLTAYAVVGGLPIAQDSQDLVISEEAADPPITSITMVPGGGGDFTFSVPPGWALVGLEGANTTLADDGEFSWYPMQPGVHYELDEMTQIVTILTDTLMPGETGRMIRLLLTPGQ